MKVAVIIVTYNGESTIFNCLDSLLKEISLSSLIIVDNNSNDSTKDIILSNYKDISLIELNSNIGFGQANNIGLELALGKGFDYFYLLNQDVYSSHNSVSKLVSTLQKNVDYGIVAPIQLNGYGSDIDAKFYDYLFINNKIAGYKFLVNDLSEVININFVNAAAWVISKKCLLKTGGFDPLFFHTGEDDDFIQRAKYWGFKIGIVPSVMVFHDRPQQIWSSQRLNFKRELTLNILNIKNIQEELWVNVLQVIRKQFYYIIYYLFKLQINSAIIKINSLISALFKILLIKKARIISKKEFAFMKYINIK